jgi:DNA-binding PadR family transcriptional regulator
MSRWDQINLKQSLTRDEELTLYRITRMYLGRPESFDDITISSGIEDDYFLPQPMPDDDYIAIGDATLAELEEKDFITQETVMRRKYWGLTEKGKAAVPKMIAELDPDPNESITHRIGVHLADVYFRNIPTDYNTHFTSEYESINGFDSAKTFDVIAYSEDDREPRVRVEVERESNNYDAVVEDFQKLRDAGYINTPHYTGIAFWVFPRRSTAYKIINLLIDRDLINLRNGKINKNTPLSRAHREVSECYNPGFDAFTTYSKLMHWDFEFDADHLAPIGDRAILDELLTDPAYDYVDKEIYNTAVDQRTV